MIFGFPNFDPVAFEEGEGAEKATDLQVVFNLQRMLMSACGVEQLPPDVAFWVTASALSAEVSEAIENFADLTKPWKRNITASIPHIKEEVVDQLFFVLQQAILLGMTSEELVRMYKEKNTANFVRIMEKTKNLEE
jgi:dimeric dUTPase (all-alpha-NTP-PPase superfamily)